MESEVVLRRKMGPATEEGRRRISNAKLRHGLQSNLAIRDKRAFKGLWTETKELLDEVRGLL